MSILPKGEKGWSDTAKEYISHLCQCCIPPAWRAGYQPLPQEEQIISASKDGSVTEDEMDGVNERKKSVDSVVECDLDHTKCHDAVSHASKKEKLRVSHIFITQRLNILPKIPSPPPPFPHIES